MTTNEERLIEALRLLSTNETRGPSPDLEARLLKTLHPRSAPWRWPAVIATLAAALILAAILPPVPPPKILARRPAPMIEQQPAAPVIIPARRPRKRSVRHFQESPPFMRIPYTEPLEPTDRAELVHVSMPAAQLLSWGFPFTGSDPNIAVNADVLVGEDGLARAVRVVQ